MWSNIITSPQKKNISLVKKNDSWVPKKEDRQTLLEQQGYTVGKELGEGGYAKVKLAESKKHGCGVAVKIVNKLTAPKEYLEKFLTREVTIMNQLRHPHIIQMIEAFETETKVYFILELAPKGDLFDLICDNDVMDEKEAKLLFYQFASAMAYCHGENVAHRDLKCENLLLDAEGRIKVTDFGFAANAMAGKLLETNCGSYDYCCPEILRQEKYNGQAADVWSMGVVLYVMLNKRPPFTEANMKALANDEFKDKIKFQVKVSKDCKHLVRKMLLTDPKKRITINEILESSWLKKVPKKNPVMMQFTSSHVRVISESHPSTQTKRGGELIVKCASTFSLEEGKEGSKERRPSTLVTDVVHAAKDAAERKERRRKLLFADEPCLITNLVHYQYAKDKRRESGKDKELDGLKDSMAGKAAKIAAADARRGSGAT